jgi:hypothetical protein
VEHGVVEHLQQQLGAQIGKRQEMAQGWKESPG